MLFSVTAASLARVPLFRIYDIVYTLIFSFWV